jgi:hypothetical protein
MRGYLPSGERSKFWDSFAFLFFLCPADARDNRGMILESRLLPVGPMARRLRVPVRWLRAEAEAGRIPHVQAERVLLFDPDTVEAVLLHRAQGLQEGLEGGGQ